MKYLLGSCLLLLSFLCPAQTGVLTGKLVDSSTKQPLALATVSVFQAADTVLVTYRLSTPEGGFRIPSLPSEKQLRVLISFSGYSVFRKEFRLSAGQQLDLGSITLSPSSNTLEDVIVVAERPPVVVKKDTIEFNANAFKTLPTALVEDLLKKLPGVQVDADGNITVNGRKVNRLMVDGKDFFGGDPKMATRNLPANIIDKVQVSDDKDEAELNPDKPKGDLGQVINLRLKKAIKQGWFGKAYAGGGVGTEGHDGKYEAGGIINLFRDTAQVSVLAFTNNLNKAGFGFNDIRTLGGFDRNGINNISIYSQNGQVSGLQVNGVSFGGSGEGISTSLGAGYNGNTVFKNGLVLNNQYFYGQSLNNVHEIINRKQFLGDTTLDTRATRDEQSNQYNHRLGLGIRWKIDSLTRLEFKPNLTFTNQDGNKITNTSTTDETRGPLNLSTNRQQLSASRVSYDHSLVFFRNFHKKGRSFNLSNSVSSTGYDLSQTNNVLNRFYSGAITMDSVLDQLRKRNQQNTIVTLNASWTEPLGGPWSVRLGYTGSYLGASDRLVTDNKSASGKYDVINDSLSNSVTRNTWRNTVSPMLNFKRNDLVVNVGASLLDISIHNAFGKGGPLSQHYNYLFPSANINYKQFSVSYNASANPPEISDVQTVPDNTNPLYINYGNPNLKPSVSQNINLNFFKSIPASYTFFSAYLNANFIDNAIVRARTVRPDGVQVTTPVNADGVVNLYNNFGFNRQFKLNKGLQLNGGLSWNINYNHNYLIINERKSYQDLYRFSPYLNAGFNWKDQFEGTFSYSYSWNTTTYENNAFPAFNVKTSGLNGELIVRWPKHIVLETQTYVNYNNGVAPGLPSTITILNAGITLVFLKDDKGQLKLSAYDLLRQNASVSRYISENYIQDRQINVLSNYYMLTFTYNIRSFKGGKVGGREKFFFF